MEVTFHGVRGSCPCPSRHNSRYGANTASVVVEASGVTEPLLLDLGTGLHRLAEALLPEQPFRARALVTHLHFDHVQGLPFFPPVHVPGSCLDIYGPTQPGRSLEAAFHDLIRPPYFPVDLGDFAGDMRFHDVLYDEMAVGSARVTVRPVPHVGPTVGYRIECQGRVVTYISDHQAPAELDRVDAAVLELCQGADLLIHDAQYTTAEFAGKPDWGHSTFDYALLVATEAGVRQLCLFHHDPLRSDDALDRLAAEAQDAGTKAGIETVVAASEGMVISV